MTGIVLAGGRSSRIGKNKAFIRLGEQTLLERVLARLGEVCTNLIIVANNPELYHGFVPVVVTDIYPGKGPLGGIHAGLVASGSHLNFVAACDMPFLDAGLIGYMGRVAGDYDVVVPFVGGNYEPMHAVYSRDCLPAIEEELAAEGVPRIVSFYPRVRVRTLSRDDIRRFAVEEVVFCNINTSDDLCHCQGFRNIER